MDYFKSIHSYPFFPLHPYLLLYLSKCFSDLPFTLQAKQSLNNATLIVSLPLGSGPCLLFLPYPALLSTYPFLFQLCLSLFGSGKSHNASGLGIFITAISQPWNHFSQNFLPLTNFYLSFRYKLKYDDLKEAFPAFLILLRERLVPLVFYSLEHSTETLNSYSNYLYN